MKKVHQYRDKDVRLRIARTVGRACPSALEPESLSRARASSRRAGTGIPYLVTKFDCHAPQECSKREPQVETVRHLRAGLFAFCTFAATFNLKAFSRMNPVASS